jgi:hypothetical protein
MTAHPPSPRRRRAVVLTCPTGRLGAEFGRSFNRIREFRLAGDYLTIPVPLDNARPAVQEARRLSIPSNCC